MILPDPSYRRRHSKILERTLNLNIFTIENRYKAAKLHYTYIQILIFTPPETESPGYAHVSAQLSYYYFFKNRQVNRSCFKKLITLYCNFTRRKVGILVCYTGL